MFLKEIVIIWNFFLEDSEKKKLKIFSKTSSQISKLNYH